MTTTPSTTRSWKTRLVRVALWLIAGLVLAIPTRGFASSDIGLGQRGASEQSLASGEVLLREYALDNPLCGTQQPGEDRISMGLSLNFDVSAGYPNVPGSASVDKQKQALCILGKDFKLVGTAPKVLTEEECAKVDGPCKTYTGVESGNPEELLPAWRWKSATSLTTDYGAGTQDLVVSMMTGIAGMLFAVTGMIWGVLLAVMRMVFTADILDGASRQINNGYLSIAGSLVNTGIVYLIMALLVVRGVLAFIKGKAVEAGKIAVAGALMIGLLFSLGREAGAGDSNPNKNYVSRTSPAGVARKASSLIDSFGYAIAGGFRLTDQRLAGNNYSGRGSEFSPNCKNFDTAMYTAYGDLSVAQVIAPTRSGDAAQVQDNSVGNERAPMVITSILWQRAVQQPWTFAQFGQSDAIVSRAGCHRLDVNASRPPRESQLLGLLAGYPEPVPSDGSNWTAETEDISIVVPDEAKPFFTAAKASGGWMLSPTLEAQSAPFTCINGVKGGSGRELGLAFGKGIIVVVDNGGESFNRDTAKCVFTDAGRNMGVNQNLVLYSAGGEGREKDWRRIMNFWWSCRYDPTHGSPGDEGYQWTKIPGMGGPHPEDRTCRLSYNEGRIKSGRGNNGNLHGPINGDGTLGYGIHQAQNGKNGAERITMGAVALVTSLAYAWALGALSVGTLMAQFGLLVLLMLLPFTLILLAWPDSNGSRASGAGMRMLRITISLFGSKIVFVGLLAALIQTMALTEMVMSAILPFGEVFLSMLSPIFALFLLRKVSKMMGLGDFGTLSGALGFTTAAALKAGANASVGGQKDRATANMFRGGEHSKYNREKNGIMAGIGRFGESTKGEKNLKGLDKMKRPAGAVARRVAAADKKSPVVAAGMYGAGLAINAARLGGTVANKGLIRPAADELRGNPARKMTKEEFGSRLHDLMPRAHKGWNKAAEAHNLNGWMLPPADPRSKQHAKDGVGDDSLSPLVKSREGARKVNDQAHDLMQEIHQRVTQAEIDGGRVDVLDLMGRVRDLQVDAEINAVGIQTSMERAIDSIEGLSPEVAMDVKARLNGEASLVVDTVANLSARLGQIEVNNGVMSSVDMTKLLREIEHDLAGAQAQIADTLKGTDVAFSQKIGVMIDQVAEVKRNVVFEESHGITAPIPRGYDFVIAPTEVSAPDVVVEASAGRYRPRGYDQVRVTPAAGANRTRRQEQEALDGRVTLEGFDGRVTLIDR